MTSKAAITRRLKVLIDKITNEVHATEQELPKLASKGYPAAMIQWCQDKLDGMMEHVRTAHVAYLDEAGKTSTGQEDIAALEATVKQLDVVLGALDTAHISFKKEGGAEIKKLIC